MNNTQNFIKNHQSQNVLNEGMLSKLKTVIGITKNNPIANIDELKNKITDAILEHFINNRDVQSFEQNSDDLTSNLYPIFTNTDFKSEEFQEYYDINLKSKYGNKSLDDMRSIYSDFRTEIRVYASQKKYNVDVQYMKYMMISPSVKEAPDKKLYITLDNTSLKNFNINLMFIKKVLMNPAIPQQLMFKVPFIFDNFVKNFDNFIYYFLDPKYAEQIAQHINSVPHVKATRQNFLRSDFGKDVKGSSDTQLVLSEFVQFLSKEYNAIQPAIDPQLKTNKTSIEYKNIQKYLLEVLLRISLNAAHRT